MPVIVEEPAEGELEEGVVCLLPMVLLLVGVTIPAVGAGVGAELVGRDGIEVGGISGVADGGDVGGLHLADVGVQVYGLEERM